LERYHRLLFTLSLILPLVFITAQMGALLVLLPALSSFFFRDRTLLRLTQTLLILVSFLFS